MRRIITALAKAFVGFGLGMVLYFSLVLLHWQFGSYPTADIATPMTVTNENKIVSTDDWLLSLKFEFTKYTNLSPVVSRNIVCADDTVHFVYSEASTGTTRPVGTFTASPTYMIDDTVPLNTDCVFQFTNEYQVNPIRVITKVWSSEPFQVKE